MLQVDAAVVFADPVPQGRLQRVRVGVFAVGVLQAGDIKRTQRVTLLGLLGVGQPSRFDLEQKATGVLGNHLEFRFDVAQVVRRGDASMLQLVFDEVVDGDVFTVDVRQLVQAVVVGDQAQRFDACDLVVGERFDLPEACLGCGPVGVAAKRPASLLGHDAVLAVAVHDVLAHAVAVLVVVVDHHQFGFGHHDRFLGVDQSHQRFQQREARRVVQHLPVRHQQVRHRVVASSGHAVVVVHVDLVGGLAVLNLVVHFGFLVVVGGSHHRPRRKQHPWRVAAFLVRVNFQPRLQHTPFHLSDLVGWYPNSVASEPAGTEGCDGHADLPPCLFQVRCLPQSQFPGRHHVRVADVGVGGGRVFVAVVGFGFGFRHAEEVFDGGDTRRHIRVQVGHPAILLTMAEPMREARAILVSCRSRSAVGSPTTPSPSTTSRNGTVGSPWRTPRTQDGTTPTRWCWLPCEPKQPSSRRSNTPRSRSTSDAYLRRSGMRLVRVGYGQLLPQSCRSWLRKSGGTSRTR